MAGFAGAAIATLAIYIPSSILVYAATRWWHRATESPWRGIIERGLAPVAVGLVFAGALAVMEAAHVNALQILTTMITAAIILYTRLSVYLVMATAALVFGSLQFV